MISVFTKLKSISRATQVMLLVGAIIVGISVCQGAINAIWLNRDMEDRVDNELSLGADTTLNKLSAHLFQSQEDIKLFLGHKSLEDYFTAVLFEDNEEIIESVAEYESFLKVVFKAKPKYTKIQLSAAQGKPILQMNLGSRVESFDDISNLAGFDFIQKLVENQTANPSSPTVIHKSIFDENEDGWAILTVSPIRYQGVTEGFLTLYQPVQTLLEAPLSELGKASISCIILSHDGEVITWSNPTKHAMPTNFSNEKTTNWKIVERVVPNLEWVVKVGMPKDVLYAQQRKYKFIGLASLFISLGLAIAALWGLNAHQNKLEKKIALREQQLVNKNDELQEALLSLENAQEELMAQKEAIEKDRSKIQAALDEIFSLIQRVSDEKHFGVKFIHPALKSCWKTLKCEQEECPCYGKDPMRCWQIVGTYNPEGGNLDAACFQKGQECQNCNFFQEVTFDPIFQIGEQFNNMMHILENQNMKLENAYADLKASQIQMLQQEKMATVGLLAAGVAHEVNNPLGFIISNLNSLKKYTKRLLEFIGNQEELIGSEDREKAIETLKTIQKNTKIGFVSEDIQDLIGESLEGAERVKEIVQNLKSFSRLDQAEYQYTNINECLENTIKIIWNEMKYKVTLNKEFGRLESTRCFPQQLNQVFMNLLLNATHTIDDQGEITVKTWEEDKAIFISISDTGQGISPEHVGRIFEPFFTTKEVGQGTGLGLSIAYEIITQNHNGSIDVKSEVGEGTTFTIEIPLISGQEKSAQTITT